MYQLNIVGYVSINSYNRKLFCGTDNAKPNLLKQEESICFPNMLTTTMSSDPTPLSIGQAGTSAVSLKGVPSVTGVGHCGSKGCTRATLLTICRSFGGRTTAVSCMEDTVTTLLVALYNASA